MVSIRRKILNKGDIIQEQLIRVLQRHEDYIASDTTSDSAIAEIVGDSSGGLVKDVADLNTSKANVNHTHTLANVSDLSTVQVTITYEDTTTETLTLVQQETS